MGQVHVRIIGDAERAIARCGRVLEVASDGADIRLHVLPASPARGRLEMQVLNVAADDVGVGDGGGKHARDKVRKGRDAVHEDPKPGERVWAGEDTAEDEGEGEEKVGNVASRFGSFDAGDDHTGEGGCEKEEREKKEEHEPTALSDGVGGLRVAEETDGVVPGNEEKEAGNGIPGEFDNDVGEHEGAPVVSFRGALAHFVEGTLGDEVRHDLLNELAENSENHEDGEELVLEALQTVFSAEEGKADEEALCVC